MKFRNYLETIAGVDVYPMISLLIFFTFFTGLAIWAFKANKQYINEAKNLPLDNDNN
ncbi:MAG: CcoQ/FixQ family Cbb3-type cytochrome c oxidase assembly chaperone [Taibaiella sp.]|nr:CcoQ/FixQ family Cbb3-type cytochrome c oxidase assembly chaperone [Taibaiella sp.]